MPRPVKRGSQTDVQTMTGILSVIQQVRPAVISCRRKNMRG
jgi:hypothetical protein